MSWRIFTPVRIAVVVGILLSAIRWQNPEFLQLLDARAMDYRQRLRGPIEPSGQVVIVAIDDESIAELGRWVWPRAVIAQLFERIDAAAPRVIALDIVFSETSAFQDQALLSARPHSVSPAEWEAVQNTLEAQDRELAEVFARSGRFVLGYFLDFGGSSAPGSARGLSTYNSTIGSPGGKGESRLEPALGVNTNLPQFQEVARSTGYFNITPDRDGPVRRLPLVIPYKDQWLLPLSVSALRTYAQGVPLKLAFDEVGVKQIRFGPVTIPVDEEGRMLINYRGKAKTFPHISAVDILRGKVPPETFHDKIVLVGVTATAVYDVRVTPFDEVFPGVEIHANVIDNILQGDFLYQPMVLVLVEIATILALVMVLGIAMMRARGVLAAITAVVLLTGSIVGTQAIFVIKGWPISLFYPVLAVSVCYASIALLHYIS